MNWIKENKIASAIIIILVVVLAIVYLDKQPTPTSSVPQENSQQATQNNNASKVSNLYKQMLPSLPAHDLYCIPSKKSYCTLEGCEDVEANIFILLGQKKDSLFLARCDNKPCDVYDVNLIQSGEFTSFETKEPHGMLFRTSNLDQSFIEVVTLGTDSFVSNGYCYKE